MTTTLYPAPVEQALVTYLTSELSPVHVGTKVPTTRPTTFVRLTRSGGAERNLVQADVQVLVECWGNTDALAWQTTVSTSGALRNLREEGDLPTMTVMTVTLTEPVNFPDSLSGSPRYQFLANLVTNLQESS